MRNLQLRFGGLHLRLGGFQRLGGLIVIGARGPAVPEQRVLAFEMIAGLGQLTLGGGEVGLRRAQGIELVLRLQASHQLSRLQLIPEPEIAFQQPSRNAKRERHLVLGFDAAGEHDGCAGFALFDDDGPHGPAFGRRHFRFRPARRERHRQCRRNHNGSDRTSQVHATAWNGQPAHRDAQSRGKTDALERGIGPHDTRSGRNTWCLEYAVTPGGAPIGLNPDPFGGRSSTCGVR